LQKVKNPVVGFLYASARYFDRMSGINLTADCIAATIVSVQGSAPPGGCCERQWLDWIEKSSLIN
jgi:hypothetical protein